MDVRARLHGVVDISVLNREMFSEAEAARLLTVPQSTLHYWLEGGERRGRSYRPVLRAEPTGARVVTWAEFIEAGLLRQYRRALRVPMAELRAFIDRLRDHYRVPYPSPTFSLSSAAVGSWCSRPRRRAVSDRSTPWSQWPAASSS